MKNIIIREPKTEDKESFLPAISIISCHDTSWNKQVAAPDIVWRMK